MGFFSKYPYQDEHELNLDWLISQIRKLTEQLDNFVSLNTIKYADPIQWDITRQYMTNTVVIDGVTGTAYLSTRPVPSGVMLNDPTYWTVIFTLDIYSVNENITKNNAGLNVVSTFPSYTGDWLLWNNVLYKVIVDIPVNTAYVVGTNLTPYSVDDFVHEYVTNLNNAITDVDNKIGELTDLNTTDQDSIVDAINEVLGNVGDLDNLTTTAKDNAVDAINEVNGNIGNLANLPTTDKSSIVNAIIELANDVGNVTIVTPEMYGAVGDGVADDTTAIQLALNNGNLVYLENTYLIHVSDVPNYHHGFDVKDNTTIFGHGTIKATGNDYANYDILNVYKRKNVVIKDITIIGERSEHVGITGEWGMGIAVGSSDNIRIENVTIKDCWGDGLYIGKLSDDPLDDNTNIKVVNCTITNNRRNNISVIHGEDILIDGCTITNANGVAPQRGIDIEPDTSMSVHNCIISNCYFKDNVMGAIGINHFTNNDVTEVIISNNTFENQNIGGFVTGGISQHSLPIIDGNVFHAMTSTVVTSSNFAYVFTNNTTKTLTVVSVPCLVTQGVSSAIKNNQFDWYTSASYIIEDSGTFTNINENVFIGQCLSRVIYAGGQYGQIINNMIQIMTNATGFVLMDAPNLIIAYNTWATIHTPAYFVVVGPNFTQGTEAISFNRATFSSAFVNTGTVNKSANVENGSFVA